MLGKFGLVTAPGVAVSLAGPRSSRSFVAVDVTTLVFE